MTELVRQYWDWFLLDTLLWTGVLIALVLLLRRPVARHLGAGTAYALWALPALRLLIPPLTLPAWMAPAREAGTTPLDPTLAIVANEPAGFARFTSAAAPTDFAPVLAEPTDFVTPLVLLWLLGATVFLVRRFWLYAALRRELLDDAIPVGEAGRVRLVETPAIAGPIAFGVIDKVVALPVGFMTLRDRHVRDLAIAHELEHHRGHDLWANILIQPLFALHWFNPLGYMGWTALRRDQEAFCDARVVAARPRAERAAYASVIADFARRPHTAPRPALAAPMACPVLGDKSIIHRLRSLSMNDVSPRRQMVARSGIAAALFALPMTASICYASANAAPHLAPAAPVAPASPAAPAAPPPVEAVTPVEAVLPPATSAWMVEHGAVSTELVRERAAQLRETAEFKRQMAEELRRAADEARAGHDEARAEARAQARAEVAHWRAEHYRGKDEEARAEARAQARAELARAQAEVARERAHAAASAWTDADQARVDRQVERAMRQAPKMVKSCRFPEAPVTTRTTADGHTIMYVCESAGERIALKALHSARASIAAKQSLSDEVRSEILRDLDEEIARHAR